MFPKCAKISHQLWKDLLRAILEHFGIFTILEQRFHSNCRQQIKLKLQKAEENLTLLQKDLFLVFFWQKMQIGKLKAGQNVRNVLKCVFPKCIAVQNKNQ